MEIVEITPYVVNCFFFFSPWKPLYVVHTESTLYTDYVQESALPSPPLRKSWISHYCKLLTGLTCQLYFVRQL